jgi:hypothetical protein
MRELVRRQSEWKGKDQNTRCAVIADITMKSMPAILANSGVRGKSLVETKGLVRDVIKENGKCPTPELASVFYSMRASATADEWDGLINFADIMTQAVTTAGGGEYSNPSAVTTAVYDVMATASSYLTPAELDLLAIIGNVDISSANEWEAYYSAGGGGYGTGNLSMPEPMSVFRLGWFQWRRAAKIVAADAAAGYYGFRWAGLVAAAEPPLFAGIIAASAIVGSGLAFQATM